MRTNQPWNQTDSDETTVVFLVTTCGPWFDGHALERPVAGSDREQQTGSPRVYVDLPLTF